MQQDNRSIGRLFVLSFGLSGIWSVVLTVSGSIGHVIGQLVGPRGIPCTAGQIDTNTYRSDNMLACWRITTFIDVRCVHNRNKYEDTLTDWCTYTHRQNCTRLGTNDNMGSFGNYRQVENEHMNANKNLVTNTLAIYMHSLALIVEVCTVS